ncbi:MAG: hypothetical protein WA652_13230 [Xanthobacteraceae bacterium]
MKATKLVALTFGISAAVLASPVFAQPDAQAPPPRPDMPLSAHRMAALKKCTEGTKFESDKYVNCMTSEGENP